MSQTKLSKPVLFISYFCEHSKTVLAVVNKKALRPHLMIVNVDKFSGQLPSFLKSVPTILNDTTVITDDGVLAFVDEFTQTVSPVEITPFDLGDMGSHVSDRYSFIDDSVKTNAQRAFSLVGSENTTINTPKEEEFFGSKTDGTMDKIKAERETDIKRYIGDNTMVEGVGAKNIMRK